MNVNRIIMTLRVFGPSILNMYVKIVRKIRINAIEIIMFSSRLVKNTNMTITKKSETYAVSRRGFLFMIITGYFLICFEI